MRDDDPMVAKILGLSAKRLGFQVALTSTAAAFMAQVASGSPSHVAVDLARPGSSGLEVLDQLAHADCAARLIIFGGAEATRIHAALDPARAKGLTVAGALKRPFTVPTLHDLLR